MKASQAGEVTKIDLRKEFKQLYNPPVKEVVLVEVPDLAFLMVDGTAIRTQLRIIKMLAACTMYLIR